MATEQQTQAFIKTIAPLVQKYAPQYGIKVCSPIIAQACLESAYGCSSLAEVYNFFGIKWRNGNLAVSNKWVNKLTSEQTVNGVYYPIYAPFAAFDSLEDGITGYFQFISKPRYANLKGVTDPLTYLMNIRADGYATSLKYVENNMNVIRKHNLTQYDNIDKTDTTVKVDVLNKKYYRVQCGAYVNKTNAEILLNKLSSSGFQTMLKRIDELWKVQVGAYSNKTNAELMLKKLKDKGFNGFITYS